MARSKDFFERAFQSISTGIYIVDKNGNYIFANQAFIQMTGGSEQEILGLNIYDMLEKKWMKKSVSQEAMATKKAVTLIQTVVNPKRFKYRQMVTANPVLDKNGNVDYVVVEVALLDKLNERYQKALMGEEDEAVSIQLEEKEPIGPIIYESRKMADLLKLCDRIAPIDSTVLIKGESGVGKEVIAHYIHDHSKRRNNRMVEINCAALPENLLEAELFGYEKGAFTGALHTGKKGLIESAQGGTLFLDEINSLPLNLQGKLLRTLETKTIKRIGAVEDIAVDFRLLSATNRNLKKAVKEGWFREDLYYRLNVLPIKVPALWERPEDIMPLCVYFTKFYCEKYGKVKLLGKKVFHQLMEQSWPGNVRELKNFVERLILISDDSAMEISEIPPELLSDDIEGMEEEKQDKDKIPGFAGYWKNFYFYDREGFSLKSYMEQCEKEALTGVLKECGSTYKAAKLLKANQSTIARKKLKYHIQYGQDKEEGPHEKKEG